MDERKRLPFIIFDQLNLGLVEGEEEETILLLTPGGKTSNDFFDTEVAYATQSRRHRRTTAIDPLVRKRKP